MPKMKHRESQHTIDVAPAQVPMYESQGWRKINAPKKSAQKPATNTADTATTKE